MRPVIFTNTGNVTYQDADGTLKIWVPSAVNTPVVCGSPRRRACRSLAKPKRANNRTSTWSATHQARRDPHRPPVRNAGIEPGEIREPHPAWRRAGSNHRAERREAQERRVDRSRPRASHSSDRVRIEGYAVRGECRGYREPARLQRGKRLRSRRADRGGHAGDRAVKPRVSGGCR